MVFVLVLGLKFGSLMFISVVCFNVREIWVVFSKGCVKVGPVK